MKGNHELQQQRVKTLTGKPRPLPPPPRLAQCPTSTTTTPPAHLHQTTSKHRLPTSPSSHPPTLKMAGHNNCTTLPPSAPLTPPKSAPLTNTPLNQPSPWTRRWSNTTVRLLLPPPLHNPFPCHHAVQIYFFYTDAEAIERITMERTR